MTDTETNRALAEALGYTVLQERSWFGLCAPNGHFIGAPQYTETKAWAFIPNYCSDWAAMGELWAWLIKQEWRIYFAYTNAGEISAALGRADGRAAREGPETSNPSEALARAAHAWLQARERGR